MSNEQLIAAAIREFAQGSFSALLPIASGLDDIAEAIRDNARATERLALAITPAVEGSHDETGGYVTSLTEAAMGVTAAISKLADASESAIAEIRESHDA